MSDVTGKVCAVTGAGSGIGRALAVGLARRGARVAISDRDEAGLAATAELIRGPVHTQGLDVTDREAVAAWADAVAEHFGAVNQIYNNAGIAFNRTVLESGWEDYERVLGVNLWGVLHGTKAFLGHLIASGDGHVVNISSLNGFMAQGGLSAYCTSKFGVRGFTESLRIELLQEGAPVQVSVVHPGGVRTSIAANARAHAQTSGRGLTAAEERRALQYERRFLRMPPERAAQIVLDGVAAGRPRILVGNDARLIDKLVRALPARYPRLVARLTRDEEAA
jgi:NAD(P)-dependent dehydrogenase (short-subunit alcohol dehydrogenase family)